jgi:hypothetical protein
MNGTFEITRAAYVADFTNRDARLFQALTCHGVGSESDGEDDRIRFRLAELDVSVGDLYFVFDFAFSDRAKGRARFELDAVLTEVE